MTRKTGGWFLWGKMLQGGAGAVSPRSQVQSFSINSGTAVNKSPTSP